MKTSFILYLDQYEPIKNLTPEQKGKLLDVLFLYNLGETPIIEDPIINLVFGFFKTTFDRDADKYLKRCDKNRENIRKRWNKDDTIVYDGIQPDTKHTDSDSGTESESGNGNVNDNKKKPKKKQPSLLNYLKQKITDYGYTETEGKIIEFFNYRQSFPKAKRYKTEKGINGLFRHISGCRDSGLNVFECLEITMEEGWQTPNPEYFKNQNQKNNGNGQGYDAGQEFIRKQRELEAKNEQQ